MALASVKRGVVERVCRDTPPAPLARVFAYLRDRWATERGPDDPQWERAEESLGERLS